MAMEFFYLTVFFPVYLDSSSVKSFEIRCLEDLNGDGILLFNCVFSTALVTALNVNVVVNCNGSGRKRPWHLCRFSEKNHSVSGVVTKHCTLVLCGMLLEWTLRK
jgi:hypothetical protein